MYLWYCQLIPSGHTFRHTKHSQEQAQPVLEKRGNVIYSWGASNELSGDQHSIVIDLVTTFAVTHRTCEVTSKAACAPRRMTATFIFGDGGQREFVRVTLQQLGLYFRGDPFRRVR